uniref:Uncharacterized protein n=1 Tax=Arundo donax TaxID=35708 RepID=A0A0A9BF56_ARUDO
MPVQHGHGVSPTRMGLSLINFVCAAYDAILLDDRLQL